jgi:hypothetical protein
MKILTGLSTRAKLGNDKSNCTLHSLPNDKLPITDFCQTLHRKRLGHSVVKSEEIKQFKYVGF